VGLCLYSLSLSKMYYAFYLFSRLTTKPWSIQISTFVTNTFDSIRTSIQSDVASVNSAIKTAVDGINKINPFNPITVPQFSIPSLSSLQNVSIPTDFESTLIKLNSSLPSIADIKNQLAVMCVSFVTFFELVLNSYSIDTPFEEVKKEINDTFLGISFNSSLLAVPDRNTLAFCGNVDTSVVDNLAHDIVNITKIGIILIAILILLMLLGNCLLEWYKWRCLQQHLEYTRQAWTSDPTIYQSGPTKNTPTVHMTNHNLLTLQGLSAHPLFMRIANRLAVLLRLSPSQHVNLQWFFHYVFHPPALACFLIGSIGLASVQLQMLAISPLEAKYAAQTASSVSGYSNAIATSINNSMYNQSSFYANQVNGHVDVIQSTINNGVFGWVNSTTTTLNSTLVNFYSEVQGLVNTVFGGTILENPMQDFVKCIIGSKVTALEGALTFLHDNLQVNLPRMNESVLVLSQTSVDEATQPIALAAVGSGTNNHTGVVGRIVNAYVQSLQKERIMFLIFMGLWFLVVLVALAIIFWHSHGRVWLEAYKKRKWYKEQRGGFDQFAPPNMDRDRTTLSNIESEKGQVDLPSFTPMPSPKPGFLGTSTSPRMRVGSFGSSQANSSQDSLKPPQHPLRSLNPNFEKSWDSFIDSSAKQEGPTRKKSSRVLLGMGLKGSGTGRSMSDDKRAKQTVNNSSVDEGEAPGFLKRKLTQLFSKEQHLELESSSHKRSRSKPQLSISVEQANTKRRRDNLSTVETTSPSDDKNGLSSAWSLSPAVPRSLPWTSKVAPTQKPTLPLIIPLRPKPRVSEAVDQTKTVDTASHNVEASAPTHLAPPLHHGFLRPIPADSPRSVSPPPGLLKAVCPPRPNYLAPPLHPTTRVVPPQHLPANRMLNTKHAREPSPNPFVTPFDDEYSTSTVTNVNQNLFMPSHTSARQSVASNPFSPRAI
jgi:hypothetical protein